MIGDFVLSWTPLRCHAATRACWWVFAATKLMKPGERLSWRVWWCVPCGRYVVCVIEEWPMGKVTIGTKCHTSHWPGAYDPTEVYNVLMEFSQLSCVPASAPSTTATTPRSGAAQAVLACSSEPPSLPPCHHARAQRYAPRPVRARAHPHPPPCEPDARHPPSVTSRRRTRTQLPNHGPDRRGHRGLRGPRGVGHGGGAPTHHLQHGGACRHQPQRTLPLRARGAGAGLDSPQAQRDILPVRTLTSAPSV